MAKKELVSIDSISRAAVKYNNVLRELPFYYLNETAKSLRLNIVEVEGKDVLISKRRRAGILAPYSAGMNFSDNDKKELIKFFEATLQPEMTYAEEFDNITNYRQKKVISNKGEMLDNKNKKHPLELLILTSLIKSYGEDVAFALFFASRDVDVKSPGTAFNGFNSKIQLLQTAGEIAVAKGNQHNTGAFAVPSSETDYTAYEKMVEFIATSNPLLLKGEVELRAALNPITAARKALQNKLKYQSYPGMNEFMEKLRSDSNCPGLTLLQNEIYGSGDQLMLTQPGLFDIGVSKDNDAQFVQVRQFGRDPNDVQYWIQTAYDTRINDIHPKLFRINDQINKENSHLAGDYTLEAETPTPEPETEE